MLERDRWIVTVCSALATVLLIVMVLPVWPNDEYLALGTVLVGGQTPSFDLGAFLATERWRLGVDAAFIFVSVVAWLGAAQIIAERSTRLAGVVVVLALVANTLDFVENELESAAIQTFLVHGSAGAWGPAWVIVRNLSFWLLLMAIAVAAWGVAGRAGSRRWAAVVGGAVPIAIPGLVDGRFYPVTHLWLLGWFAALTVLLWRQPRQAEAGAR
jgi:hypothetical protein